MERKELDIVDIRATTPEALIKMVTSTPLEEEAKSQGVTPAQMQRIRFALMLVNGVSTERAATAIGIGVSSGYRWAAKDELVQTKVAEFRKGLTEKYLRMLARGGEVAISTIIELIQTAESEKVRLDASFGLIDRLGMRPQEVVKHIGDVNEPIVLMSYAQLDQGAREAQQARANADRSEAIDVSFTNAETPAARATANSALEDGDTDEEGFTLVRP